MHQSLTPLSLESHKTLGLATNKGWSFAAASPILTIVGAEIQRCAAFFPVAIMDTSPKEAPAEQREFELVTIHSVSAGENWFVTPDGRWIAGYIPAVLRAVPFRLMRAPDTQDQLVLCIDENSPLLVDTTKNPKARPLFETDGTLSADMRARLEFLTAVANDHSNTRAILAAIAGAGLLAPWSITINKNNKPLQMKNLYRVDAEALNALPDDVFLSLRKSGALPLIYNHLASLAQTENLQRAATLQDQIAHQQTGKPKLEDMLDMGQNQDIELKF